MTLNSRSRRPTQIRSAIPSSSPVSSNRLNGKRCLLASSCCSVHDSSGTAHLPSQVIIHSSEGGLTGDYLAKTDQIAALTKTRLTHRRGMVTAETVRRIEDALLKALDIRRP